MHPGVIGGIVGSVLGAAGDIDKVDKTIKIMEIRVQYHLTIPADKQEEAQRALEVHPAGCPAHQSVKDSIRIKIDANFATA